MFDGSTVLLAYAAFMILGGVMGQRAGSRVSLWAGAGSGLLLIVAWFVAGHHPAVGLWAGAVIAALLSVVTGMRLKRTGKMMPSGLLLVVSLIALVLLARSALAVS